MNRKERTMQTRGTQECDNDDVDDDDDDQVHLLLQLQLQLQHQLKLRLRIDDEAANQTQQIARQTPKSFCTTKQRDRDKGCREVAGYQGYQRGMVDRAALQWHKVTHLKTI